MIAKFSPKAWFVVLVLQGFTVATLPGCALIQLPLALVGAIISIVAIPVNVALSLVGPATSAAAAAAPYAMLFAKQNSEAKEYDLVIVEATQGQSRAQCVEKLERAMGRHAVASLLGGRRENIREFLAAHHVDCYLARV